MNWSSLASAVPVVGGIYGLMVLFLFVSQSRLLYQADFPTRDLVTTPARIDLVYEDINLRTEDGVLIHGWWLPHPQPRGALLFFHGNAGNISHRLDSLRIFHNLGLGVLIIDYRGYGQSEGSPSEEGTYLDAEAAWRHLTEDRGIPAQEIVLFGRSLGGAVAAWLAALEQPAGLIVESGFTSVPDLAAQLYPFIPVRLLVRFDYDTRAGVAAMQNPVLIIHSRDDDIIPFSHGEALHAAAPVAHDMLVLRGGHNDGFIVSHADYVRGLDAYLDRVLD